MLLFLEKTLTEACHKQVLAFLGKLPVLPIEQYPEFQRSVTDNPRFVHAYAMNDDDSIVFYAQVREARSRRAIIEFGPMFTDPLIAANAIALLYHHYRKRMFAHIYILQGQKTSYDTELFERIILNQLPARLKGVGSDCWRTIIADLTKDEESLQRAYSRELRKNLRLANAKGITVTLTTEEKDVNAFAEIFIKMYKFRNLPIHPEKSRKFIHAVCNFLWDHHLGELIVTKNNENKIIGGIILIKQNTNIRIYKSASDPESRPLPIQHLMDHYALMHAKSAGAKEFDFWGYPIIFDKADQRYHINRFKKTFGGSPVFFPLALYIRCNIITDCLFSIIFSIYTFVKQLFQKLR